jgi:acyl dehydratase
MPEAVLTDELIEEMKTKIGLDLRIEHSVFNEEATRIAVAKFVAGIGDINPLWTDAERGAASPFGGAVAPPSFVIGCFSGLQFGWAGLGSFHAATRARFHRPIYWNDRILPYCRYEGFSGPKPSSFAGRMMIDHFVNAYDNQNGDRVADLEWDVINFERGSARARWAEVPELPHRWTDEELERIEAQALAEIPRGSEPLYVEDVSVGDALPKLTKGPIGLTDEIAFVAGGGAPIPRLSAHAVALQAYERHPEWSFRDPITNAREPIYSVHYNNEAAYAMGVAYSYDVGFQRQCWQIQLLTNWCSDPGWVTSVDVQYRGFVYLSDVIELTGTVTDIRVDDDGEHVVDIRTSAVNQRGDDVMPGRATVALPSRNETDTPAGRRAELR